MTYRAGKCYDSHGNEMTQSQINMMYKLSMQHINEMNKPSETKTEDIASILSEKFKVSKM